MTEALLYLDTNHLSALARNPSGAGAPVLARLQSHSIHLAFSLFHLQELSHPDFRSRDIIGKLLDGLSLKWAVFLDRLYDMEVDSAYARAAGLPLPDCSVFLDQADAAWGMPAAASIPPSQMLDVFATTPHLRLALDNLAQHGANHQKLFGRNAVAVQRPDEPLMARIRDKPPAGLLSTPRAERPSPAEILKMCGGLPSFPSYQVFTMMTRTRMADTSFPVDSNHVMDEFHAAYTPYVSFIALDRTTVGRYQSARLPRQDIVFRDLTSLEGHLTMIAG